MKIALTTGPFHPLPPGPAGAVERLTADLARRFVERGHEVTLVSRDRSGAAASEVVDGVHHIRVQGRRGTSQVYLNILKDLPYSFAAARKLPKADVWVLNSFWLPVLARLRRDRGTRLVVTAHRYPKGQYSLYRGVDRITAVSTAVGKAVLTQAPWASGILNVIPNPIDTRVFTPRPRTFTGPLRFLYAGRIHPEKGLETLVRAFVRVAGQLPGCTLTVMGAWRAEQGGGGAGYLDLLKQLAGSAPVEFKDPLFERQAFADALRACDIFVYPSVAEFGESFGVAPLEAMATGAVAVVSALDCFLDYVAPDENACVFDHRAADPATELSAALLALASDPAGLQRLSAAGAAKALEFDYEKIVDLHLADYARLIAG